MCLPSAFITPQLQGSVFDPGFDDATQLLVDSCDTIVDGKANYFLGPNGVFGHKIVLDLNCVVVISEVRMKNSRNSNFNE